MELLDRAVQLSQGSRPLFLHKFQDLYLQLFILMKDLWEAVVHLILHCLDQFLEWVCREASLNPTPTPNSPGTKPRQVSRLCSLVPLTTFPWSFWVVPPDGSWTAWAWHGGSPPYREKAYSSLVLLAVRGDD